MKIFILVLSLLLSSHLALASQALIEAARDGDLDQVTQLIVENDNVNDVDRLGITALMWAASEGYIDVVQALLARPKIKINYANHFGNTALMCAAQKGSIEVVNALLARPEILINHANNYGDTAVVLANSDGHPEIAQLLEDAFERSRAHLISPAVMEITNLPPELSDLVTNGLVA